MAAKLEQSAKNWWQELYEDTPFELYMRRTDEAGLDATIDFLMAKLHLKSGSLLFDQCCGFGSMSLPIAARGVQVLGVDLCAKYITEATRVATERKLPCRFVQGDAFQFSASPQCDAAINWWTSFGYSEDDATNCRMLSRAFESIKDGGWFALDYPNMANYFAAGKPSEVARYDEPGGQILVVRESTIDLRKALRRQLWTFFMPNGRKLVQDTAIKIYLPNTVIEMLASCGFVDIECVGGIHGQELSMQSSRCIFLARKP